MSMAEDVSRALIVLLGLIAACSATVALAHDGHGERVIITGTIQAINADRIQIETRDDASLQMKRVSVVTTKKTRYKRGKARVEADAAQLTTGERVVAIATGEHTQDNSLRLLALQIDLSARKK
jgi:methionine-rich copper-binding protein CopC